MKQLEVKRKQIEYLSAALEVGVLWALGHRVGMEGMGFFLVAFVMYVVLWTIIGENLPDAVGRIIRSRRAKGQYDSVKKVKGMAIVYQLVMGFAGTFFMIIFGTPLGNKVFGCPYSKLLIWLMAPVIFLRGMSSLFIGFSQGEGSELPAVISCLLRQALIYGFGIVFGNNFGEYGEKISSLLKQEHYTAMYTAAGWCLAMVIAELVVFLFVFMAYAGTRRKKRGQEQESLRAKDSFGGFIRTVHTNMSSKVYIRLLELYPFVAGMCLYYIREKSPLGYGSYFLGYLSIVYAIVNIFYAIIVPYWGKVAGFIKHDDMRLARTCFQGGLHLIFGFGLLVCVCVAVMAKQVGNAVGFTSPNIEKFLVSGSFWIVCSAIAFYSSRMLMRLGKKWIAIGMGILCDILFQMIFMILWSNAGMGLMALLYASLITTAVYALLLTAVMIQLLSLRVHWLNVFVIPGAGACLMALVNIMIVKLLGDTVSGLLFSLAVGAVSILLYAMGLIVARNFGEEELSVMPGGNVLLSLGRMMGVF